MLETCCRHEGIVFYVYCVNLLQIIGAVFSFRASSSERLRVELLDDCCVMKWGKFSHVMEQRETQGRSHRAVQEYPVFLSITRPKTKKQSEFMAQLFLTETQSVAIILASFFYRPSGAPVVA